MSATLNSPPSFVRRCRERPELAQNGRQAPKSRQKPVKTGLRMANRHVSAGHVV
jgi:hypothetical protein